MYGVSIILIIFGFLAWLVAWINCLSAKKRVMLLAVSLAPVGSIPTNILDFLGIIFWIIAVNVFHVFDDRDQKNSPTFQCEELERIEAENAQIKATHELRRINLFAFIGFWAGLLSIWIISGHNSIYCVDCSSVMGSKSNLFRPATLSVSQTFFSIISIFVIAAKVSFSRWVHDFCYQIRDHVRKLFTHQNKGDLTLKKVLWQAILRAKTSGHLVVTFEHFFLEYAETDEFWSDLDSALICSEISRKSCGTILQDTLNQFVTELQNQNGSKLEKIPSVQSDNQFPVAVDLWQFLEEVEAADLKNIPQHRTVFDVFRAQNIFLSAVESNFGKALFENCNIPVRRKLNTLCELLNLPNLAPDMVKYLDIARKNGIKDNRLTISLDELLITILARRGSNEAIRQFVRKNIEDPDPFFPVSVNSDIDVNLSTRVVYAIIEAGRILAFKKANKIKAEHFLRAVGPEYWLRLVSRFYRNS